MPTQLSGSFAPSFRSNQVLASNRWFVCQAESPHAKSVHLSVTAFELIEKMVPAFADSKRPFNEIFEGFRREQGVKFQRLHG